jgi:hypothetical protein
MQSWKSLSHALSLGLEALHSNNARSHCRVQTMVSLFWLSIGGLL